jgi:hypothetical protein
MPRNDTVLTPRPTRENFGNGFFEAIVRVLGNSIEVAGSASIQWAISEHITLMSSNDTL